MHLSHLFYYPVKGCRGHRVDRWPVFATGLQHDREFMLVDEQNRFVTQRSLPRLALLEPQLSAASLKFYYERHAFELPLDQPKVVSRQVNVWHDEVQAQDMGDEVARWLSLTLSKPLRLVRLDARAPRQADQTYTQADRVPFGFADGFPFLILSWESLQDLNARLQAQGEPPVGIERFRPNLVVTGGTPYCEDQIEFMTIGTAEFRLCKPCTRCRVTTVDQTSGEPGTEPLKTLAAYRRHPTLKGPTFGQNAYLLHGESSILTTYASVAIK
jgi:hypothetical protein